MSSDTWNVCPVRDLIDTGVLAIGDGYRAKNSELEDDGLPFARAGNIKEGFHFNGTDRLGWHSVNRVGAKVSLTGDVVFTSKGTVGRFALVREDTPRFVYSPQLCYWRSTDVDVLDPSFLYYWMTSTGFLHQVAAVSGQTDMAAYVSLRDQRRMSVTVPPIDEQRRIAAILGALDDQIELNRKMNRTLEEIAQALFKSWFIDFDGVPPGDLVDSALGPIPKGWEVTEIGKAVKVVGGGTPSTKNPEFWEGGTHCWTTPKDLSSACTPILFDTARRVTDAGLAKISSGLLPVDTFLLSSRAPVGYTSIAKVPLAVNQGYIAIPPGGSLSPLYLLHWTRTNLDVIKGRSGGTTFQEISKRNFRPIPVAVPPKEKLDLFDDVVGPLFDRLELNVRESSTLQETRDTLLPKLISGELRVPATEGLGATA